MITIYLLGIEQYDPLLPFQEVARDETFAARQLAPLTELAAAPPLTALA